MMLLLTFFPMYFFHFMFLMCFILVYLYTIFNRVLLIFNLTVHYNFAGILWSFRFPTSRRKMAPTPSTPMSPPQPHMDISKWLDILDLTEYGHIFDSYKGVEV